MNVSYNRPDFCLYQGMMIHNFAVLLERDKLKITDRKSEAGQEGG